MTMNGEPQLHPSLEAVAGLLGVWAGHGHGEYPTIEPFDYFETVTFSHVGKPFLIYEQRTRRLLPDGTLGEPLHAESGYWRMVEANRVELVLAHPSGIVEVEEGAVTFTGDTIVFDTATTEVAGTSTAKSVTALGRTLALSGDTINYSVEMAAVGVRLTHHLAASLTRQ